MAKQTVRISRKEPLGMDVLIKEYIRSMKLSRGLDSHRIFEAWDEVSGAAAYTLDRSYKDGILRVTLSSSVVRNNLYLQRKKIADGINERLSSDPLFSTEASEHGPVKTIILK